MADPSSLRWESAVRMGLQQEVGRQIRLHRERKKLSQLDLAEAVGRTVQMIGRIERGESAPRFDTLEAIADVLETPAHELFVAAGRDEAEAVLSRVTQRLAGLDSETLQWVDELLVAALRRPRLGSGPQSRKGG